MCIGIPMKILELPSEGRAICEGRGKKENIDVMMIEDPQIGEWILYWNGMATKRLTPERAAKIGAAIDLLEDVVNGREPSAEDPFADITANTGKLPPHLAALVNKKV